MFLDKDLPIIGRLKCGISPRVYAYAIKALEKFGENRAFPGQSLILDGKGKPFRRGTGGETIKFRRYKPFKI